ncbi:MAG: ribonuclease R [Clostridia bacterium]|nr:ribonuclease R [Clostridia bacterium]
MDIEQRIKYGFETGQLINLTADQICRKIGLKHSKLGSVRHTLDGLEEKGEIIRTPSDYYTTRKAVKPFRARVNGNKKGFGFITPLDAAEPNPKDFHVYRENLGGAYDRDVVLAGVDRNGEGFVLEVLERANERICGTVTKKGQLVTVVPDNDRFSSEIAIKNGATLSAAAGQKVLVKITSFDAVPPAGEIAEILGEAGDFMTEELSVIRGYSLYEEFSDKAEEQALLSSQRAITVGERRDLRNLYTITIDGTDTRDMDDAISIEKTAEGYVLGVHIADVAEYVEFGSKLDTEAYDRGTSVYFPDRVYPMLPRALSNGSCSLNEKEDRYALSCMMTYDLKGKLVKYEIGESVIRSDRRMSYPDANAILDGNEALRAEMPDAVQPLADMLELRSILRAKREAKGCIDLDVKEAKILYEDGRIEIPDYSRGVSEDIIEQFMIAANECVAEFAQKNGLPILYRVHETPLPEKSSQLAAFLHDLGVHVKLDKEKIRPRDYADILEKIKDHPAAGVINTVMLRSMQKARYCEKNLGHFGLASSCYCHFTSPIRRYPDLFTHRTIKAFLHGDAKRLRKYSGLCVDAATDTSEKERVAETCERAVDSLYMCAYMQSHIGEDYEAEITGVTNFGIFASLPNTVEGLIRIEELPYDNYAYSEISLSLTGKRHRYAIGDKIHIIVKDVSMQARKIYFSLYEMMQC